VLDLLDWLVIAAYGLLLVSIALICSRGQESTQSFFLANRKMSGFAVACSIIATEMSAATFIGVPSQFFKFSPELNQWVLAGSFIYLQFTFGSILGRILIAKLLLPAYYRFEVTTIYELFEIRFGKQTHLLGTLTFFVSRILGSGSRLFIIAFAASVIVGIPLGYSIIGVVLLALFYTWIGGIKAVIWTDVAQVFIFVGGAIISLFFIQKGIPGGFDTVMTRASEIDALRLFDFSFSFHNPFSFWVGIIGGMMGTMAGLGADQDLTQRMLTCKTVESSQRSLISTGFLDFPIVALFLVIGLGLGVYFEFHQGPKLDANRAAHFYPWFITHVLPSGVRGLLVSAMFAAAMSSLDSALSALGTSFSVDVAKKHFKKELSESELLSVSKKSMLVFSVLIALVSWLCRFSEDNVLVLALKLPGFTLGGLLGLLLLASLTKRGTENGNLVALIVSVLVTIVLNVFDIVSFGWLVVFGTMSNFLVAFCFIPRHGISAISKD